MTLYTKKAGQYSELSKDDLRKLRRTSQVMALQVSSRHLTARTRALAAWLLGIHKLAEARGGVIKLAPEDLAVTRLPNVDSLLSLADEVDDREKELHKC